MKKLYPIVILVVMLFSTTIVQAQTRKLLSLNGKWSAVIVPTISTERPKEGWKEITVPGVVDTGNSSPRSTAWFKREINIPEDWKNSRMILDLRGARFNPQVYIDGKKVGGFVAGWWPGEVEITSAVTPGKTHLLEISCDDWQSQIADGYVYPKDGKKEDLQGKVIAPVGGYKTNIGIWDDINLNAIPSDRIIDSSIIITPSTRNSSLALKGKIEKRNSRLLVHAAVMDEAKSVIDLGKVSVKDDGSFELSAPFPNAKYWSPEQPQLYQLQITLNDEKSSEVRDQITQRFGFREIWTTGSDFYLNGVKRHFLAGSYWPPHQSKSKEDIRKEMAKVKASGCNSFRLHIGGWQEEWLNAADEIGLMIVDEIPAYTDGDGMYAYKDERFWENYRQCISGMIERGRNHASLVLWSLGNEILFMGNKKYDEMLPKKLGQLASYCKSIDIDHPVTFEADLDPDGQYDVIGLHYPHEMPQNYAYPNTADWLEKELQTEAGGGMLGKASNKFFWDRKKPLYIGEYLWVPMGDYSTGTIYFGELAYLNREGYQNAAKRLAWSDQTLAYRRADVTGMCPWGATGDKKEYFLPVAAFMRNRSLRIFSGTDATIIFDVFNDSEKSREMTLAVKNGEVTLASKDISMAAGKYSEVKLSFKVPASDQSESIKIESILSDKNGQIQHCKSYTLRSYPQRKLQIPKVMNSVVFDPSGAWPGSVNSWDLIARSDPKSTILIIAPEALGQTRKSGPTLVGDQVFDNQKFKQFVQSGGRAIVLEQQRLSPLGLDLSLNEHSSTMTFPLSKSHPILEGLSEEDSKYWADDNYVSEMEIRRPESGGAQAVLVSGGPNSLDQGPILEMSLGDGHIVFIQALVGRKLNIEPVAGIILQNTVNYLSQLPQKKLSHGIVISEDKAFKEGVNSIAADLKIESSVNKEQVDQTNLLILQGSEPSIERSSEMIQSFLNGKGKTLYWSQPTAESFAALKSVIGAESISLMASPAQAPIDDREHPLLKGVSREDLTFTTAPISWTRNISTLPAAVGYFVTSPIKEGKQLSLPVKDWKSTDGVIVKDDQAIFTHRSSLTRKIDVTSAGKYIIKMSIKTESKLENPAQINFKIKDLTVASFRVDSNELKEFNAYVMLPAGEVKLDLSLANQSEWGDFPLLSLSNISLVPYKPYPQSISSPLTSGALIEININNNRVILDMVDWYKSESNHVHGHRYASALFENMGADFKIKSDVSSGEPIPNSAFELIGESKYFSNEKDQIAFRNNGKMEAGFETAVEGRYKVYLRGNSSTVRNIYAKVRIGVDNLSFNEVYLDSKSSKDFVAGEFSLSKGIHKVSIEFTNDELADGEDRNAFIESVQIGH